MHVIDDYVSRTSSKSNTGQKLGAIIRGAFYDSFGGKSLKAKWDNF